jgi:hypothetical protein
MSSYVPHKRTRVSRNSVNYVKQLLLQKMAAKVSGLSVEQTEAEDIAFDDTFDYAEYQDDFFDFEVPAFDERTGNSSENEEGNKLNYQVNL